ncbi:bacillithiol biosynthesis cysteine-adding enzyme BshC [uncultured Dokdonia sp.]|uniref:bacillithiol biosynthesis cysteine-adding enzyme BshC n=1 Tax=uncultured Dokdonia sp. TaxID=575653 RepID=UPI002619C96E|nr:bacillithiol biosynthesis cysteine-adding enzyme BshC [uncultured Dokdonia sp.]
MQKDTITYSETGYFSKLICQYLDQNPQVAPFYHRFPSLDNFEAQIKEKQAWFTTASRDVLVSSLQKQYAQVSVSDATQLHIEKLSANTTFTITTGHQLNLFTGPLYFLYKIIHTITLSRKLKQQHPHYDFVPIYWMATEDHDFDEINYFRFKGSKIQWNREDGGAVGELSTEGLDAVLDLFKTALGSSKNAQYLASLFEEAYLKHTNLADATRYLANELFSEYGLVIVDGNDVGLKTLFAPYVARELFEEVAHKEVTAQTASLTSLGYPEQVHPREINLFYIIKGIRERIIREGDDFVVNNTEIRFTEAEIRSELEAHPERFSPNALLRPLFQEIILPNLTYIGGGGELAYWFQLKSCFEAMQVPFPMLLLRNSALIRTEKQKNKIEALAITNSQLFLKQNELVNQKIRAISNIDIDLSTQRTSLKEQFKAMHTLAAETDASFLGAVKAQEVKQLKGLDHLEKRLLKAQKRKLKDQVQRVVDIQNAIFPLHSLQERNTNFAEFYLEYGADLVPALVEALDPVNKEFTIVTL